MSNLTYAHDKKAEARAAKQILVKLAELGGKMHNDDDITYQGTRFIIPESMDIKRAVKFLGMKMEELETATTFSHTFNYRPWDGAWCMWNALKRVFGMVSHQGTPGFFGKNPPQMVSINVDVDKQEQVPWGAMELPILPGVIFTTGHQNHPESGTLFRVIAEGPKKYAAEIKGIFKIIEDELETNSMYRGKAFDGQQMPEFIDLSTVRRDQVVYSKEVMRQLEVNIWAQLRYTNEFAARGIPLKRAVLVHGPYGCGKTLAAMLTGQEATENGWTFIKARPGRDDLGAVMQTARLYQPAVVFYEDVDLISDGDNVSETSISQLLDNFDGIDAKGARILCVLTTNHAERIHKGMARPGRLDAMIEINDLDLEGVSTLVQTRVKDLLHPEVDWEAVFEASQGFKPAFVTEFADRSIRYVISRNSGTVNGEQIRTEDLVASAVDLRPQYEVMEGATDRHEKPPFEESFKQVIVNAVRENVHEEYLAYKDE